MVTVAVLTAMAVELAYSSRVSLQIAANARDELRAGYAARGGVALARLVLSFQQQLDDMSKAASGTVPIPRVQLWNLVPVDSGLAEGLFPAGRRGAEGGHPAPGRSAGVIFEAKVDDEALKVNAQLEGFESTGDLKLWQRVQTLYQLLCDSKWDPLFDREDARGNRTTREDLLVRLHDWVDEGDRTSELAVAGGAGATCGLVVGQPPFVNAFGDENQPYDRGDERYRVKNAHMDSLDELYLVAGVGDAFMAAFRDDLTVYLPMSAKLNVNVTSPQAILFRARLIADQPLNPMFLDPTFLNRLQVMMMERTLGGLLSITPREFAGLVEAAGVKTNPSLLGTGTGNGPNDALTDRSDTFRIRATAKAGAVVTGVDAVVRMEPQQKGTPVAAPGRLVHWREE
jgi:general secretion pathway protein K